MVKTNFDDFNFEIIDINTSGKPYMLVGKNTISFSNAIAAKMNYPSQVLAYLDYSSKTFAIKSCKAGAQSSIKFSKKKTEQKGRIILNSSAISSLIKNTMNDSWVSDGRYEIEGTYLSDSNSMIFELLNAKNIGAFKGGPNKKEANL